MSNSPVLRLPRHAGCASLCADSRRSHRTLCPCDGGICGRQGKCRACSQSRPLFPKPRLGRMGSPMAGWTKGRPQRVMTQVRCPPPPNRKTNNTFDADPAHPLPSMSAPTAPPYGTNHFKHGMGRLTMHPTLPTSRSVCNTRIFTTCWRLAPPIRKTNGPSMGMF